MPRRALDAGLPVLAALLLLPACTSGPPLERPEQVASDQGLADRVYAALNRDPTYYFRHVDVRVTGGVAQLSGYVWSSDAVYRAKQLAATVPEVTGVVNQLQLEREGRGNAGPTR